MVAYIRTPYAAQRMQGSSRGCNLEFRNIPHSTPWVQTVLKRLFDHTDGLTAMIDLLFNLLMSTAR